MTVLEVMRLCAYEAGELERFDAIVGRVLRGDTDSTQDDQRAFDHIVGKYIANTVSRLSAGRAIGRLFAEGGVAELIPAARWWTLTKLYPDGIVIDPLGNRFYGVEISLVQQASALIAAAGAMQADATVLNATVVPASTDVPALQQYAQQRFNEYFREHPDEMTQRAAEDWVKARKAENPETAISRARGRRWMQVLTGHRRPGAPRKKNVPPG